MTGFSKNIKKWLTPRPMDDIEWDEARRGYLEDRVREICEPYVYDLESVSQGSEVEIGRVVVPVRTHGAKSPEWLTGRVYLQKGELGEFDVSLRIPRTDQSDGDALSALHTWQFHSEEEAEAFVTPPSQGRLEALLLAE